MWGFPEAARRRATIERIKRGDMLVLAHSYRASTADNPGLGGRRKLDDFLGSLEQIKCFSVYKGCYYSNEPIWTDQGYPHRVNLGKIVFSVSHVVVDYLNPELRKCLHGALYQSPTEMAEIPFNELAKYAGHISH